MAQRMRKYLEENFIGGFDSNLITALKTSSSDAELVVAEAAVAAGDADADAGGGEAL